MTQEMGKPIAESRGEVRYAAGFVEWYAEEAKRAYGDIVPTHVANKRLLVTRQPVGPVYAVTPWNFPAAMVTRKVAPALAAGCTVILKPAEQSPFTAIRLGELWVKAGGPPDVFQVITTSDPAARVGGVLRRRARSASLPSPAAPRSGSSSMPQAAHTMKRVSLELGGHAPFIVFGDADVDERRAAGDGIEIPQRRPNLRVRESHLRAPQHSGALFARLSAAVSRIAGRRSA